MTLKEQFAYYICGFQFLWWNNHFLACLLEFSDCLTVMIWPWSWQFNCKFVSHLPLLVRNCPEGLLIGTCERFWAAFGSACWVVMACFPPYSLDFKIFTLETHKRCILLSCLEFSTLRKSTYGRECTDVVYDTKWFCLSRDVSLIFTALAYRTQIIHFPIMVVRKCSRLCVLTDAIRIDGSSPVQVQTSAELGIGEPTHNYFFILRLSMKNEANNSHILCRSWHRKAQYHLASIKNITYSFYKSNIDWENKSKMLIDIHCRITNSALVSGRSANSIDAGPANVLYSLVEHQKCDRSSYTRDNLLFLPFCPCEQQW